MIEEEFNVDIAVSGYWSWSGKAKSPEIAERLAIESCTEANFGELENIDFNVCEVYKE